MRIGYLGPPGTYSHEAALKRFPEEEHVPCNTLEDVVGAVQTGLVDRAVLPVENSTNGPVNGALDSLLASPRNYVVSGEVRVLIVHQLYARCPVAAVKRVYSHPQVWGQTVAWRKGHLGRVEYIDSSSTSRAVELALADDESAAVAGVAAGVVHDAVPVVRNVSDRSDNTTRFLVLANNASPDPAPAPRPNTVLITVQVSHEAPGALMAALDSFARNRINLRFLCPRPAAGNWSYVFFVEFDGALVAPHVQRALEDLAGHAAVAVLGEYAKDA